MSFAMTFPVHRDPRWGEDASSLKWAIMHHLRDTLAKDQYTATKRDYYQALAHALRDRLIDPWLRTQQSYHEGDVKRVCYLSAEFMLGRLLDTVLVNLRIQEACRQALRELGQDMVELNEQEWDAGLGAGGLGRLAACFLDSMATLALPAHGYGIRYEYGSFLQQFADGYQVEKPDNWLRYGNPWEIPRPDVLFPVHFHGKVHQYLDENGVLRRDWRDTEQVMAMAYDIPIPGYSNGTVNTLRLWGAKSSREFDLDYFNHGDYVRAVEDKNRTENLARVLYPQDDIIQGRELRLKQEYFLASATLQDIIRRFKKGHASFTAFPAKVAIQLNDTHPALAVPELMRLLMDREKLGWDVAWDICVATFGYTNHTILPEALERWPISLLERVLPRHLQIIYEINHRFLRQVEFCCPGDTERLRRVSLIEEEGEKQVRMANLAVVGSHAINGVSALHTDLLCRQVFPDYFEMDPGRFSNKTNGISPRLWLLKANPQLAELITYHLGGGWLRDLSALEQLAPLADDPQFRSEWALVKQRNKQGLAACIRATCKVEVNPGSLFDVHIKRIHEYKRQLLNVLHVITLYNRLRERRQTNLVPRTVLFAGKAAPSYRLAKLIIKLINSVADVVNGDPSVHDQLRVVFLPNYRVSLAEKILPAADLSEQISTAGTEASGTGNMKLALNGALTIGTLDGANVEIREAVGDEQIFLFGLTAEEVAAKKRANCNTSDPCDGCEELRQTLSMIREGFFSPQETGLFGPILDSLFAGGDPYMVLADFAAYVACQGRVSALYGDQDAWTGKSILNTARVARFSSDRTIREYAREIWGLPERASTGLPPAPIDFPRGVPYA